jgi:hypothetical protein
MSKDSGVLIIGVVLTTLGFVACFKGMNGEGITLFSSHFADGRPSNMSALSTVMIGLGMIIGGGYFLNQSGYFNAKE